MARPEISIITPAYNAEQFIADCIESACEQGVDDIEHIVVDDGSSDQTPAIVKEYDHIKYIRQSNSGANAARNNGISRAKGRYVKFLDADDYLIQGALVKQIEVANRLQPNEITYGRAKILTEATGMVTDAPRRVERSANPVANLIMNNIMTSLPLYPISCLESVAGFDDRMHANQEWHLNLKLAVSGYRFVDDGIPVYYCRRHDGPYRISNRPLELDRELKNLEFAHETIRELQDPEVLDAWSAYVWSAGRVFAGRGQHAEAALLFEKARKISPKRHIRFLSRKYRFLRMLLGPYMPDRLYYLLKNRRMRGG